MRDRLQDLAERSPTPGQDGENAVLAAKGREFAAPPDLKDRILAEVRANRSRKLAEIEERDKIQELQSRTGEPKAALEVSTVEPRPTLPVASKAQAEPSKWSLGTAAGTIPVSPIHPLDMSLPAVARGSPTSRPLGSPTSRPLVSPGAGWSPEDERLQQEAIRTIEILRCKAEKAQDTSTTGRKEMAPEWSWKEASEQQVMCLEYELDGKEAALQLAEKHLEQRDAELQEVHQQLELLRAGDAAAEDAARIRSLRIELEEKDRQLELKDTHIQQLMAILHQHGSSLVGGESDRHTSASLFNVSAYPPLRPAPSDEPGCHCQSGSD